MQCGRMTVHYTATHCKHTATRCHTLQHRGTQCVMMQEGREKVWRDERVSYHPHRIRWVSHSSYPMSRVSHSSYPYHTHRVSHSSYPMSVMSVSIRWVWYDRVSYIYTYTSHSSDTIVSHSSDTHTHCVYNVLQCSASHHNTLCPSVLHSSDTHRIRWVWVSDECRWLSVSTMCCSVVHHIIMTHPMTHTHRIRWVSDECEDPMTIVCSSCSS